MRRTILFVLFSVVTAMVMVGCTRTGPGQEKGKAVDPKVAEAAKAKYLLASEPTGAKGVLDVKTAAKDGEEVVVVGRIGGSKQPFTGRAAFTIVDAKFKSCDQMEGDSCSTPWDYCCAAPDELAKSTILVKLTDASGKTLPDDAKALLGMKELETVVVKGQARRDESNSIGIVASGIYIQKK